MESVINKMKEMLKIFICHLSIASIYLLGTSLKFIYDKHPNPIGHGLLLWFCLFSHVVGLILWMSSQRKQGKTVEKGKHILSVLLLVVLFVVFSTPFHNLLWNLRGQ